LWLSLAVRLKAFRQPHHGGQELINIQAFCLEIRLCSCPAFRFPGKALDLLHYFPAKTGTSPAKALTKRRARKERAEEQHEKNRSYH
jgi:hypothetical protein